MVEKNVKTAFQVLLVAGLGLGLTWLFGWVINQFFGFIASIPLVRLLMLFISGGIAVAFVNKLIQGEVKITDKESLISIGLTVLLLIALQFIPGTTPASLMIVRP